MKLNNNKKSVKISRSLFMLYAVMVCGIVFALPAFAADDPLVVVENLSTFIFSLIRAVGLILLGWGIVQVGLSLQSHDPSQRSQGFLTLAGGLVITDGYRYCPPNVAKGAFKADSNKPSSRMPAVPPNVSNRALCSLKTCSLLSVFIWQVPHRLACSWKSGAWRFRECPRL